MLDKGSVLYYTKAVGTITVYFPEDKVSCEYCPYRYTDNLKVARCRITEEFLPYVKLDVGNMCPLEIVKEE